MSEQELRSLVAENARGLKTLRESVGRLEEAQAKTDAQLAKTDAQLAKTDAQLAKTDAQLAKTDEKLQQLIATSDRNERRFNALNKNFQGYQANESMIQEDYFFEAIEDTMIFQGITYDTLDRNLKVRKGKELMEFDIFGIASKDVLLLEIKRKPHLDNLKQLLHQCDRLNFFFPELKDHKVHLALGGSGFYPELITAAKEQGITLIRPFNGGIEVVV